MAGNDVERLIRLLSKLPGLGPRSARRAALHMIQKRETVMEPLAEALSATAAAVRICTTCGNIDTSDPCAICVDPRRDHSVICVVEGVGDLWALERANAFRGRYHVLGGVLSALDGVTPEDLNLESLMVRAMAADVSEIILATNATVDGQTTAHYLTDRLADSGVSITRLARGLPVGGELDYLDDGTLLTALSSRKPI
ncbi:MULTISPECIES: recombination mediator RecR [unclassified Minwuia]|jgi:recombination protein RecR|uniref:recombination mediator RecR n=1 Tax=unclassified Minwuia TaxID=2618799 RepID=UPI00247AC520|nr:MULTISPECIES: recombination mediator RecR [unclassified Minwuia]